ncbi:DinB family protein [Speluncibacter jeojiensis]|uniref:DinB family protein n=1 Tax=Speluncibacter jeojiensis TaxID=2710754 RepID=A0A9X4M7I9_9ACTN|nr:DinB family protein [Corynebacteriales bacterium D3-21]
MTATTIDERTDLLASIAGSRRFLRYTAQGLTDEQATARSTTSELTIGGLIKHVTAVERSWARFIVEGPSAMPFDEESMKQHMAEFHMGDDETLAGLLDDYEAAARETEELVHGLPSLDVAQPLPEAPWFEKGVEWSARKVLLHILAETAQHAGHADIVREAIDGQKTMG